MRDDTIARNYAETLFELAERHEGVEAFGTAIAAVGDMVKDAKVREFLATPRVPAAAKKATLERALGPTVPALFLSFLKVVVDKRRQRLLSEIGREYEKLLDRRQGRRYVEVAVARPLAEDAVEELAARMSKATGAQVIPHVKVVPGILGGVVVRDGDTVYDGSLKRQLGLMQRRLMAAELPPPERSTRSAPQ